MTLSTTADTSAAPLSLPCAAESVDPALFDTPDVEDQPERRAAVRAANQLAKGICAGCPVRLKCLAVAVETKELYGIWGGTTPEERFGLDRDRRPLHAVEFRRQGVDAATAAQALGVTPRQVRRWWERSGEREVA